MSHPEGTRAWRKSHRRKWRDGSSYRGLTLLQREFLRWIEDNANDEGRTPPTGQHFLARLFSSPREVVSRDQIQRAAVTLERVGLVARVPHSLPHKEPHKEPHKAKTVYVRAKFAEYQEQEGEPHKEPHKEMGREPRLGSRGSQKKAEEKKGADAPPREGWQGLVDSLTTSWQDTYPGAKLVWAGREFRAVKALRESIPDEEILRRFANYLGNTDPFYAGHPVATFCSQVNRFVAAPVRDIRVGSAPAQSHAVFEAGGGGVKPW